MGRSEGASQGKKLMGFPNLKFIAGNSSVICNAQRLIEKQKINPRDAIHIASAINKKITEIASDDSEFHFVKEMKRVPL